MGYLVLILRGQSRFGGGQRFATALPSPRQASPCVSFWLTRIRQLAERDRPVHRQKLRR
jgi:hypothetical protein